ncbi:MAG: radical SAM protein [Anaerolineae bacterium]|nr:radical SAM protein [Anaerolineae bacterium]MDH7474200.1 radical SAM protein [Anaerolineae bacterium]
MSTQFEPAYVALLESGELKRRVETAYRRLAACDLCPRECGVNRLQDEKGVCHTGKRAVVSSFNPHFGEEAPLVGRGGSGTIFFSWCNLKCQFCQNYEISQLGQGREVESEDLAAMMLHLQDMGCHNINFVSPTHVVPQILAGVLLAAQAGLRLPLVYNTGGYDSLNTLVLLDGVFDIYMPDMKYADPEIALKYSKIKNYPTINQAAVKEMHRQVGDLVMDERGVALRGLLVRHLVLPEGLAGTAEIVRFLATEVSTNTYLNIMDQYRPCYKANEMPPLNRRITHQEYEEAVRLAHEAGLHRLDDRRTRLMWILV